MSGSPQKTLPIIGWREWLSLPDLQVERIKAKIDTGARSSALHAFDISIVEQPIVEQPIDSQANPSAELSSESKVVKIVHFKIHPQQRRSTEVIEAQAPLSDIRTIRSSNGQTQTRPVIQTTICLGDHRWPIELTLTNRDVMGFRMLLGRQAIRRQFLIDSGHSYLQSRRPRKSAKRLPK